jgi:D-3-phosphoglycerate dehydrogenase
MKILVSDPLDEAGLKIFKDSFTVDVKTGLTESQLVEIIPEYDALLVRSQTKVTKPIIQAGKKLKIIGRAGVGVDNIDVEEATRCGIIVVNSPEGNTIAAAEHAVALMLSLARNIPRAHASLNSGKWERSKFTGIEVYNKTLGVLGLGKIGSHVAKAALGLGMKVLAHDPFVSAEQAKKIGITLADLETIFKNADFISLHLPLTSETKNFIDAKKINHMKDGVRIINCARGGIINEKDLFDALKSGKIAGAALDVFEQEPLKESPFFGLDNVILTPHLGAATVEAQLNVAVDVADQVACVLQGGQARAAVNIPSMRPDLIAPVKPYLLLAEKLGKFAGQIVGSAISKIEISYLGEVAQYEVDPLTVTFLKGLLEPIVTDSVNFVNAPIIAKSRGIKVIESKNLEIVDFANLISVEIHTAQEKHSIAGTFFGAFGERIVKIDGFKINTEAAGYLLIIPNIDRPGCIGRVGTFLGSKNINIAGMEVGRESIGGKAVMVLNVDSPVPSEILKEISKLDGIIDKVKLIKF